MIVKKEIIRSDFVTRQRYPREKLVRLVKRDGHLILDLSGKEEGRGYYLYPDVERLKLLYAKHKLRRYFTDEEALALLGEVERLAKHQ